MLTPFEQTDVLPVISASFNNFWLLKLFLFFFSLTLNLKLKIKLNKVLQGKVSYAKKTKK
jgi:hypothetical protein